MGDNKQHIPRRINNRTWTDFFQNILASQLILNWEFPIAHCFSMKNPDRRLFHVTSSKYRVFPESSNCLLLKNRDSPIFSGKAIDCHTILENTAIDTAIAHPQWRVKNFNKRSKLYFHFHLFSFVSNTNIYKLVFEKIRLWRIYLWRIYLERVSANLSQNFRRSSRRRVSEVWQVKYTKEGFFAFHCPLQSPDRLSGSVRC